MRMRKLDARSHRPMPWKNGGGTTTEIARSPETGSATTTFDWRISMARVETSGPLLVVPEGRSLDHAILEGGGESSSRSKGARGRENSVRAPRLSRSRPTSACWQRSKGARSKTST